jgi:diamine N-acetyltransferase
VLYGKKVNCVPLSIGDTPFVLQLRNTPEVAAGFFSDPPLYDFIHQKWLSSAESENLYFIIQNKSSNQVGWISLTNVSYKHQKGEYGIAILPEYQGRGYAKEASDLLIDYVFNNLPIRKIFLKAFASNVSAIKLYEKLGFIQEGLLHDEFYKAGRFRDVVVMALFKTGAH